MGLKILHSADWHLDSPLTGFRPEQREFLKEELGRIPRKMAQLVRREGCDLVLLAGDLFDGPYRRETARELYAALEACAVPVFISPGNHDYVTPGSPWLEEKWPENVHIFTGALTSVTIPELSCRIYGAGYRSMDCPGVLQGFRAEGPERYAVGVVHGDAVQPNSPYCPITAAQVRDSGLDYLALGHIHKAGSFRVGETLCTWPGSPMGRGFDETGERGAYIVTLDDRAECRFVPLDTPRFYELELDTDRCTVDDLLPGAGTQDFYRITLTGTGEEELPALRRKLERFPNLELIDRREKTVDFWENAGEDTLEGTFFRLLQEKMENADPESARCIALAAEISARLLQGREVEL